MSEVTQLSFWEHMPKGRAGRLANWSKLTAQELWEAWGAQFESDDEAIATAVWMANRLAKDKARSSKRVFYSIKDAFIQRFGNEGWKEREEIRECRYCSIEHPDPYCDNCDGEGVYSRRWLYCHAFEVAGRRYTMHSYIEPKRLLDREGVDLEHYGRAFSDAEFHTLALPFSGLLKLLTYVAAALWKLKFYGDGYA